MNETCRLLDLAPELRNEIYELAFSCNDESIDLNKKKERHCFSPALLLTCRQIYQEAAVLFRDTTYINYTTKKFVLTLRSKKNPYATLRQIASRYRLQQMSHLELHLVFGTPKNLYTSKARFTLQPDRVVWEFEPLTCEGNTIKYYLPLKIVNGGPATRELQGMDENWRNQVVRHLLGRPKSTVQTNIQKQIEALLRTFSIIDRG